MADSVETESRKLLRRLRDALAGDEAAQARLDKITRLIADSMGTEVCSVYLFRDEETLELCATEGLKQESVHQTRMRLGEGLVGRVARRRQIVNTADAPGAKGFRYMPETGEEVFSSFCGVPRLWAFSLCNRKRRASFRRMRSMRWKLWRWFWPR